MLDFTSASYLGSEFSSIDFNLKTPLTLGKPAFLKEPLLNRWVANQIAQMQGLERGILAPSSLHLFWDLFGILSKNYVVFIEENTYPIGQWGTIHADARQLPVIRFKPENLSDLRKNIQKYCHNNLKPLIVCDALNIDSGKLAPIKEYLSIVEPLNGNLLIDDTQTFGIFGVSQNQENFGFGGGGVLKYTNIYSPKILTINSLSKAFGIPVAVLAGNTDIIKSFEKNSLTRVHNSAVSAAHTLVTAHILRKNQQIGDKLRQKLWNNIQYFRKNLVRLGSQKPINGIFPVQKVSLIYPNSALLIYQKLLENNIECLLLAPTSKHPRPSIAFCFRADHNFNEIDYLLAVLRKIIKKEDTPQTFFITKTSLSHERRN